MTSTSEALSWNQKQIFERTSLKVPVIFILQQTKRPINYKSTDKIPHHSDTIACHGRIKHISSKQAPLDYHFFKLLKTEVPNKCMYKWKSVNGETRR